VNTDTRAQSRFEDRLLAAILDDFDQLAGAPAPVRPARSRRTVPALAVGAAAAVTAAAVALTSAAGPSGRTPARPAAEVPASVKLQTAAYVVDHMRSALNANTAVVVIIDHAPDSQTGKPVVDEIWSSSRSHTYRIEDLTPAGRPVTGYLVTVTAHRTVSVTVNYRAHTWSRTVYPFGSASSGRRAAAARHGTPSQLAAQLRAEVKAGKVTLAGRDTVDGQPAIHLTQRSAGGLLSMWVSPATYLPIRVIGTAPGVPTDSPKAIRDDYRWLPATPANLRLLTTAAAVPAGFTRAGGSHG
jgi:hypothetical protein